MWKLVSLTSLDGTLECLFYCTFITTPGQHYQLTFTCFPFRSIQYNIVNLLWSFKLELANYYLVIEWNSKPVMANWWCRRVVVIWATIRIGASNDYLGNQLKIKLLQVNLHLSWKHCIPTSLHVTFPKLHNRWYPTLERFIIWWWPIKHPYHGQMNTKAVAL